MSEDELSELPQFETLPEIREFGMSSLSVVVDWMDLVESKGEEAAFEVVGKLKDLLG